jgi:hypothetical protein
VQNGPCVNKAEAGLKTNRSLNSSPEGLQTVSVLVEQQQETQKMRAELLELRTEGGPIYLRPSGWQRFWLQRSFRHFHVLPPQLLGKRNQQRIANLLQTSVVKPDQPVASSEIFGVVAQVHSKSGVDISPAGRVTMAPAPKLALVTVSRAAPLPSNVTMTPVKPAGVVVQEDGLWQWIVAGLAAAACIPLIMASVYGISIRHTGRKLGPNGTSRAAGGGEALSGSGRRIASCC